MQGFRAPVPGASRIAAGTHLDFDGTGLTPYGGLLHVARMLEKPGFQKLVEETLPVKRQPRSMSIYQFVLAMVLAVYIGFIVWITSALSPRIPS